MSTTEYSFKDHSMESLFRKYLRIAAVVSAYWIVSITLVFLNKYLLSDPKLKLEAPLFITFFQCVIAVLLCLILSLLVKILPDFISFPSFTFDVKIILAILPSSILFVATVSFNNLCLKHVNVAFYYISRSLTTVFNVIFTYIILKQATSGKAVFCCAIIVFGYLLGIDQENLTGALSKRGIIYGVLSSLFLSLYSIYIKKVLPVVNGNIWRLTFYNNLNASILFIPLLFTSQEVFTVYNFSQINSFTFWMIMICGGIVGFAIGYVTGLQIHVTSPLTHNISGTAKACAQTVIAVLYFHDIKPILWWTSNIIVLLGSCAYTHVQRLYMKKEHEKSLENSNVNQEKESLLKSDV